MEPKVYVAVGLVIFLILTWIYLRSGSASEENLEVDIEDDDDISDGTTAHVIDN